MHIKVTPASHFYQHPGLTEWSGKYLSVWSQECLKVRHFECLKVKPTRRISHLPVEVAEERSPGWYRLPRGRNPTRSISSASFLLFAWCQCLFSAFREDNVLNKTTYPARRYMHNLGGPVECENAGPSFKHHEF